MNGLRTKATGSVVFVSLLASLLAGCVSQPSPAPAPVAPAQQESTATPVSQIAAPTATPVPAGPAHFTGSLAKAHVEALAATIGTRYAGSDGYTSAIQYLTKTLTSYGYTVTEQPFTFAAYIVDHSNL